jgi:hypothetical protein
MTAAAMQFPCAETLLTGLGAMAIKCPLEQPITLLRLSFPRQSANHPFGREGTDIAKKNPFRAVSEPSENAVRTVERPGVQMGCRRGIKS